MGSNNYAGPANQVWSADWHFIQDLTTLKRLYMDSYAQEDLEMTIKSLTLILALARPKLSKLKPEEEERRILWAEDNLHLCSYVNNEGKDVETDGTLANKKTITKHLQKTFDMLLWKLQRAGVYTKNTMHKDDVGGDFSGA